MTKTIFTRKPKYLGVYKLDDKDLFLQVDLASDVGDSTQLVVYESSNGIESIVKGIPKRKEKRFVIPLPELEFPGTEKPECSLERIPPPQLDLQTEVFYPGGSGCPIEKIVNQASKKNSLLTEDFKGRGTLIIIWDSFPDLKDYPSGFPDELGPKRPGGEITIINNRSNENACNDPDGCDHGFSCASAAAGMIGGISTESQVVLLGCRRNAVMSDLAEIEKMLVIHKGPAVVSMSWGLRWTRLNNETFSDVKNFVSELNKVVKRLKTEYPVLFFAAAGNKGQNYCGKGFYSPNEKDCEMCYKWPLFGPSNDPKDSPIHLIGNVQNDGKTRALGSSYGPCLFGFAIGGPMCVIKFSQKNFGLFKGTSAAAPIAAGIASLYMSQNLETPVQKIEELLVKNASLLDGRPILQFDSTRAGTVPQTPVPGKGNSIPSTLPEEISTESSGISDDSNNKLTTEKILLFTVCVLVRLLFVYIAYRKPEQKALAVVAFVIAFLFLFQNWKGQHHGAFGSNVYWNRVAHACFYALFAFLVIFGVKQAAIVLLVDLLFGIASFVIHYTKLL